MPNCHQCKAEVQDGAPFCPSCGAPQIRVTTGARAEAPRSDDSEPLPPGTPDDVQPPATPVTPAVPRVRAYRSILLAGALTGVVTILLSQFIPFIIFLGPIAGGAFAVSHYRRRAAREIDWQKGSTLGAATGFVATLWISLISGFSLFFSREETFRQLRQQLRASLESNPAVTSEALATVTSDRGLTIVLLISFFVMALLFSLLGGIGGAVGSAMGKPPAPRPE